MRATEGRKHEGVRARKRLSYAIYWGGNKRTERSNATISGGFSQYKIRDGLHLAALVVPRGIRWWQQRVKRGRGTRTKVSETFFFLFNVYGT